MGDRKNVVEATKQIALSSNKLIGASKAVAKSQDAATMQRLLAASKVKHIQKDRNKSNFQLDCLIVGVRRSRDIARQSSESHRIQPVSWQSTAARRGVRHAAAARTSVARRRRQNRSVRGVASRCEVLGGGVDRDGGECQGKRCHAV